MAVKIFDANHKLLSYKHYKKYNYTDIFKNNNTEITIDKRTFKLKKSQVIVYGKLIGSISIIFETTNTLKIIKDNKKLTYIFVLIEILLSSLMAYFIGYRLTSHLELLTLSAKQIAEDNRVQTPDIKSASTEIEILANTLNIMQKKIKKRSDEKIKTERTIRAILNSTHDSIILISVDETILEINSAGAKILKSSPNKLKGKKLYNYASDEVSTRLRKHIDEIVISKKPIIYEEYINKSTYKKRLFPILDEHENVVQISIFIYNSTKLKKAREEIKKYMKLIDEHVFISHADINGIIKKNSKAFCEFTGYSCSELKEKGYSILRDPNTPSELYRDLWQTIKNGNIWHGEMKNVAKDGHYYWVKTRIYPDFNEEGVIVGCYAIMEDITARKMLEKLSTTDPLTKLHNRRYFDSIFDKEMQQAKRNKKIFCLLSLDVDNFKFYNDTYGHQKGDRVLFTIARILQKHMKRATDLAFRMGGEEFSAIYVVDDKKSAVDVAQKIRVSIEKKKIEHKTNSASSKYVTASFGLAFVDFYEHYDVKIDKSELYRFADMLLYEAKDSGRNVVISKEYMPLVETVY